MRCFWWMTRSFKCCPISMSGGLSSRSSSYSPSNNWWELQFWWSSLCLFSGYSKPASGSRTCSGTPAHKPSSTTFSASMNRRSTQSQKSSSKSFSSGVFFGSSISCGSFLGLGTWICRRRLRRKFKLKLSPILKSSIHSRHKIRSLNLAKTSRQKIPRKSFSIEIIVPLKWRMLMTSWAMMHCSGQDKQRIFSTERSKIAITTLSQHREKAKKDSKRVKRQKISSSHEWVAECMSSEKLIIFNLDIISIVTNFNHFHSFLCYF